MSECGRRKSSRAGEKKPREEASFAITIRENESKLENSEGPVYLLPRFLLLFFEIYSRIFLSVRNKLSVFIFKRRETNRLNCDLSSINSTFSEIVDTPDRYKHANRTAESKKGTRMKIELRIMYVRLACSCSPHYITDSSAKMLLDNGRVHWLNRPNTFILL